MSLLATITDLLLAGGALLVTLVVGVLAHELSHALVLRWLGVPFEVEWLPDRGGPDPVQAGTFGRWASVTPRSLPPDLSPWGLRVSALAPLALAAPMALILLGVLPDPVQVGNVPLIAATLAWFGCALPSPQDFSLFFHAEAAIEEHSRFGP